MRRVMLLAGGCLVALGCSGGFRPGQYATPQELFDVSQEMYRGGNCSDAELGFRRVTSQLPVRDSLAVRARFLMAECQFAQSMYLEAARQFRRVADEAPNHVLAPRALLRSGDSQLQLWTRAELDPTYGDAALVTYQEVMARYPRSEVSGRAALKLAALGERFAEKDYKNGMYYFRFGAYLSAILYFKAVVTDHGATSYAGLALIKLVQSYERLGFAEEERETCDNLRRFYPTTEHLDEVCPSGSAMP